MESINENSEIIITTLTHPKSLVVADNGGGINKELEKKFSTLFSLPNPRDRG